MVEKVKNKKGEKRILYDFIFLYKIIFNKGTSINKIFIFIIPK